MIAIKNANVVLEHEILPQGVVLIENERIVAVGRDEEVSIPRDAECVDAKGLYVGPGFVDIHVHGGNGYEFSQNPKEAGEYFLRHGTTTVLATLYYTMTKGEFLSGIARVKEAMPESNIAGFYMEGPYMNPKYGASPDRNQWRGEIREEDYLELVKKAGKDAKVWAIAPERKGIEAFVKKAKEINPDTVFAVGHSEASPEEIDRVKAYGVKIHTHCMNATGYPFREYSGTKNCGPDEACLMEKERYAELICDSGGIHVPPDLLRLVLTVKGADKVILISDSYVSSRPSPERLSHITDLQFDENGNLCGSKLTLNVACRNMRKHTGCSIEEAFLMASRNPAEAIGLGEELGSVTSGKRANLVFVDQDFSVKRVMQNGIWV